MEWPLAQDDEHVGELVEAARRSGSRAIVGLQGRLAPPVVKLKELIQEGRIGKILSSEVRAAGGSVDRETLASGLKYFADKSIGGNVFTIGLGHRKFHLLHSPKPLLTASVFDQVQYVLGDLTNINSHLQLQRPNIRLRDPSTNTITETIKSNVPDLIYATASIAPSPSTDPDASLLIRFRRGQPFKGEPALVWTINGEKGELRLIAQGGTTLHASAYTDPVTMDVHDFETDEVQSVEWEWEEWQKELPMVGRSVAKVYERFAEGNLEGLATFEDASLPHRQLNGMLARWNGGE